MSEGVREMRESIRDMWRKTGLRGVVAGWRHNAAHRRAAAAQTAYTDVVVNTPHGESGVEIQTALGEVVESQQQLELTGGQLGSDSHSHE